MLRQYFSCTRTTNLCMYHVPCTLHPCIIPTYYRHRPDLLCNFDLPLHAQHTHTHTPRPYIKQDGTAVTVPMLYVCDFTVSLSWRLLSGEGSKFLMSQLFPFSSSLRNAVRTYFINIMLFRYTSSSFAYFFFILLPITPKEYTRLPFRQQGEVNEKIFVFLASVLWCTHLHPAILHLYAYLLT